MNLIVGLGNPGKKYEKSRHNLGFMVVDELAQKLLPAKKTVWRMDKKSNSLLLALNLPSGKMSFPLVLAKPQTMVNASGVAVKKLTRRYKLAASRLFVVHDEIDLPLGKIKIAIGRGSAGHRGIQSIIRELETDDFVRFRLGVGRPAKKGQWLVSQGSLVSENVKRQEVTRYVLEGFGGKEAVSASKMIKRAAKAVKLALEEGVEKAFSTFW